MTALRTIVVDDEEPARELLRSLLSASSAISVVGESGNGDEALALIRAASPDLVFLDVQMPGMNGLDIAEALMRTEGAPLIVFVTAYDQYAVKAFELCACDYLLKPFDAERLAATIRRATTRSAAPNTEIASALRSLIARAPPPPGSDRVVVKVDGRHVFLDPAEIEWVEAVGKTVHVHLGTSTLTVRESMNSIEARLDASRFLRVRRSAIVNRAHIREIQPWFKADYVLILRRGTRVVSGRTYRAVVQALITGLPRYG